MSTNTKRLLIILGVAALFCTLSAVAAIAGLGVLANRFKEGIATGPATVQKMAHDIINYELPPGYREQIGMDFLFYKMILISEPDHTSSKPIIFLAQFQAQNISSEQMAQQMQQSVEQQGGRNG